MAGRFPFPTLPALALPLLLALPARAEPFQVFCVPNNDGTVSCEGWRGGETLTCVASPGGVSSCSTSSGRRFTCVLDGGGVSTCTDNSNNQRDREGTNCTFTGEGNFVCDPPTPPGQPLLPSPRLPNNDLPGLPVMPRMTPVITSPSAFD
jgi:hypothetical protein